MNVDTTKKFLNKVFLLIPLALVLIWLGLYFTKGLYQFRQSQLIWKQYWHLAYVFYLGSGLVELVFFFDSKSRSLRDLLSTFKYWFFGFLLSMFSYAIAAEIIDIGYVFLYISYDRRK